MSEWIELACGLIGKMAPWNSPITRLWSSAKPIDSRLREAPTTATERGAKMGSSSWRVRLDEVSLMGAALDGILCPRPARAQANTAPDGGPPGGIALPGQPFCGGPNADFETSSAASSVFTMCSPSWR